MLSHERMTELTDGLPSKSAKMRALSVAGVSRADIARFLNTRYQFVRNVLEAAEAKAPRLGTHGPEGFDEAAAPAPTPPAGLHEDGARIRIRSVNGVVTLPPELLAAMGFTGDDDELVFERDRFQFHVFSWNELFRYAQEKARPLRREGVSLVDEFIADRRREADRENERYGR